MASRKIEVEIVGDSKSLQRAFGKANQEATGFGRSLGRFAKGAALAGGAAGIGALTVGLEKSVRAGMDAQASQARLAQAFKNAHVAIKPLAGSIEGAEAAARKLGFTDDQVRDSLGSLITATGSYRKSAKDLAVAEDIARFKRIDLTQATKMLTMAQAGSQRATKQLGLTIQPVTSTFDALKASMHGALTEQDKQALSAAKAIDKQKTSAAVIQLVSDKLKGQAKAYSDTAAGGMAQFRAQIGHMEEEIGLRLLPVITRTIDKVARDWPQISRVAGQVFTQLKNAWMAVQPTVVAAGALLKRIADIVIQNWPLIRPMVMSVAKVVGDGMKLVAGALRLVTDILSGKWGQAWRDAKALVVGLVTTLKDFLLAEVAPFRAAAVAIGTAAYNGLKAGFSDAVGWVKGRISDVVGFFRAMPAGIGRAVEAGAAAGEKMLKGALSRIFGVLPGFVRDALGIKSPSRVFADIGHNIIMGAVKGIERAGPKLLSAARSKFAALAQTVAQPGTPAGAGISTGGLVPQVKRALVYARSMGWHGVVTSGFRTYAQQAALYARYLAGGPLAAPPGHSSHESGQAVDVSDYGTFGRIMSSAPAFERLYNRLGALDPVHYSVSGYAKGGIFNQPTVGVIGEAGPEAVIPLDAGIDISELGAQRIADAADRTTWARSPEVHVEELREALAGNAIPIIVMRLTDDAVSQMTGAFTGAADAIGGAVASAIGSLGGGGGDGGGGDGGGGGGGPAGPGITPLPIMLPSPGDAGTIRQKGAVIDTGPGPAGGTVGGREGIHLTTHLEVDGKVLATSVQKHAIKYAQVNGSWLP